MGLKYFLTRIAVVWTIFALLPCFADVSVRGYYRKDGTYVRPHKRSSPNKTTSDNWSTKGNVNPYTGKAGTKTDSGTSQSSTYSESSSGSSIRQGGQLGGYKATPYIPKGPPKAEGGWADSESKAKTSRAGSTPASKEKAQASEENIASQLDNSVVVFAFTPLKEYHLKQDCKRLLYSHPTEITLGRARKKEYSLCKTCGAEPSVDHLDSGFLQPSDPDESGPTIPSRERAKN